MQHETAARCLWCRARKAVKSFVSRQTGSHLRVTTTQGGEHHVTIPLHDPIKLGTLAGILGDVAEHFRLSRDEVIERIFRK